jgi:hypothetical protein
MTSLPLFHLGISLKVPDLEQRRSANLAGETIAGFVPGVAIVNRAIHGAVAASNVFPLCHSVTAGAISPTEKNWLGPGVIWRRWTGLRMCL